MKRLLILPFLVILTVVSVNVAFAGWEVGDGVPVAPVTSLFAKNNIIYAAALGSGIYMSPSQGSTWIERTNGLPVNPNVRSIVTNGTKIFVGIEGDGIYTSTDDGATFKPAINNLGNMYVFSLSANNGKIYAGTDESGVYKTTDNGSSWIGLNDGTISYSVLTVNATGSKIFAGTNYGGLYESTDDGSTWININPNVIKFDILCIAVNGSNYFVGTKDGGIFYSSDDGKNWSQRSTGFKSNYITNIAVNGNNMYASTKGGGVYFSDNNGQIWADVTGDLSDKEILSLTYDNTYLYAGSSTSGIYRRKLTEMTFPDVTAPVLNSPPNQSVNMDTNLTFSWTPSEGAVSYHILVSTDPNFSDNFVDKDAINNAFFTKNAFLLGTTYYWKVAANTYDNQKKWSEVWSFTTREQQSAPELYAPADKGTNISIPTTFLWNKTSGTIGYTLLISMDDKFDSLIVFRQNDILDTSFIKDDLGENTLYYWKLGSVGSDDNIMWSPVYSFTTGKKNSVFDDLRNKGIEFAYGPNPATDMININLSCTSEKSLKVTIIDVLGNERAKLFEGIAGGSALSVSGDLSGLPQGCYRIVMSSGDVLYGSFPFVIIK